MKINNKEISVIGGTGHVGFPLGLVFSAKNFKVNLIDIPQKLLGGEYSEDKIYRDDLKNWLYDIWQDKDRFLNS